MHLVIGTEGVELITIFDYFEKRKKNTREV